MKKMIITLILMFLTSPGCDNQSNKTGDIKPREEVFQSQNEKETTSISHKNIYEKKEDEKLRTLYDSGFLKKFNIDYNKAWVNPTIWYALDYETKLGIGLYLAKKCDEAGSTGRITFYNNKTGEKLAKYSQSRGYKKY